MNNRTSTEHGFTLIEFAISSLLTMVLMASVMALITTLFTSSTDMAGVMQTQQNLRVAMNSIAREITMAGTGLPTGGIAVPNGANSVALTRPGIGGTLATPNGAIAVIAPGDSVGPTINGVATDAVTIATIDQNSPSWTVQTFDSTSTDLTFVQEVRNGANQLFIGDLLVLTNANGSVFGCVTDVSTMASHAFFANADAMNMNQPNAASGNVKSIKNGGNGTTTGTRMNIVTYYIDNGNAAHPKLMRAANAATPQVIAEDVENLQFTFDLFNFTNNTESSNQSNTTSPNQIRAVNISLSGRSPTLLPKMKKYYRYSLVSKVNVRNNTFRNRYTGS
jgi:Tfp pilus assembly protein PilW